jgi:hypothetical protein
MVVDDVDLHGAKITPTEDNAPLIIDPNAVQPDPIPNQRLQTIFWRRSKIRKSVCVMENVEFSSSNFCHTRPSNTFRKTPSVEKLLNSTIHETLDSHSDHPRYLFEVYRPRV